jgi:hypothetical protein
MKITAFMCAAIVSVTAVAPCGAQSRAFFDANVAAASPAESSFTSAGSRILFAETASWSFKYDVPTRRAVDVAGGAFFSKVLGIGVALESGRSSGNPTITATIPHPRFFNAFGTGTLTGATPLERSETGVHIQVIYRPVTGKNVELRLSGGPSYFAVKQTLVDDFRFTQTFSLVSTLNTIRIDSYTSREVSTTTFGFNVGGDVGYFFAAHVGVGGFFRYATASAGIPNTAQEIARTTATQTIKLGGPSFGFGLRTRF